MKQIILSCVLLLTCNVALQAQNNKNSGNKKTADKYAKTSSGLEYQIIKKGAGKDLPQIGGYITFWFEIRNLTDSIIDTQFSDPNPVGIPTPEIIYKPSIEEGFGLLREGDSAVFLLNADSLYIKTFKREIPNFIKPKSTIKMIVKMGTMYSKSFVDSVVALQEKSMAAGMEGEKETYKQDSIAIQKYLKDNKLKGQATIGGAYVVKLKENKATNRSIAPGDTVQASYVGKLLIEGTEFDKSPAGEYFTFVVGMGQVIQGWDQGFQKLKHGEKAIILIPSRLAYGTRGAGGAIPPNAPLLFEVEVK